MRCLSSPPHRCMLGVAIALAVGSPIHLPPSGPSLLSRVPVPGTPVPVALGPAPSRPPPCHAELTASPAGCHSRPMFCIPMLHLHVQGYLHHRQCEHCRARPSGGDQTTARRSNPRHACQYTSRLNWLRRRASSRMAELGSPKCLAAATTPHHLRWGILLAIALSQYLPQD